MACEKHDLVVISYTLGELPQAAVEAVLNKAWKCAGKFLVLIEPGTRRGFATVNAARSALIANAALRPLTGSVGHRPGGWGWTAVDDRGRPVAHSPRIFERHGSCARSLQRFRSALVALAYPDEREGWAD